MDAVLATAVLAALYATAALAALASVRVQGAAVPMWPPAGVALAAVLLLGPRMLTVPALGMALVTVAGAAPLPYLASAFAASAGLVVAWAVMRRLGGAARPIVSMRQVLALLTAALLGGTTSAVAGAGWLIATEAAPPEAFFAIVGGWTVGDMAGVLSVTPLLLAFAARPPWARLRHRASEGAALLCLTGGVAIGVYGGLLPVTLTADVAAWMILPFVIWSALRFGLAGAAFMGLLLAAAASFSAAAGSGPFADAGGQGLASLQLFIGMVTLTGLLLAAGAAERTAAIAEVRRLSSAVEQSAASVVMTDTEGRLTYVNPRFTETSGWTPPEVLGRKLDFLRTGATSDAEYGAMWRTLSAGQVWHGEFLNRRKDGSLWWEQASISPVRDDDGRITHFVAVKEDITARKDAERHLRGMVDELRRSNRELQHFASIAAHDLQEPLRAISGFAQLLRKRYGDRLDAEADSYITFMVEGAEHMKAMFRDLLDYSQVDAAPVAGDVVDLTAVALHVRDALHREIAQAGAEVVLGPLPQVRGSRRQLELVFAHLVGNALKFRHPGRPPRVLVGAARREEAWEIHVLDNGIGIDRNHLKALFVLFRRLHTRDRYSGTGIGLAISRRIVERHGGRIWAESDGETGTAIRFTLPLAESVAAPGRLALPPARTLEDIPA